MHHIDQQRPVGAGRSCHDLVVQFEQPDGPGEETLTHSGERHPARCSDEQLNAQCAFEPGDVAAQCLLCVNRRAGARPK